MAQRNDQVFQLSLTEIAFTISFILLLLLGYLVFKEQADRKAAEEALSDVQSMESAAAILSATKDSLASALQHAGLSSSDDLISKLVAAEEARAERDRLKKQVDNLDAKLTALTELQRQLEKVAQSIRPERIKEEIDSALALQEELHKTIKAEAPTLSSAMDSRTIREQRNKETLFRVKQSIVVTEEFKKQLKEQLEKDLKLGQEVQTVQDVVTAAKGFGDLVKTGSNPEQVKKENADLRGQLTFLKKKLEARGGRDYPPCWADERTGKVEFLLSVDVRADSVAVVPAWPPCRESDARALPGISEIILSSPLSNTDFIRSIQGIFNKSQTDQCRHYVRLKSSIRDAVQSDRARLMIENYFYKVEIRR